MYLSHLEDDYTISMYVIFFPQRSSSQEDLWANQRPLFEFCNTCICYLQSSLLIGVMCYILSEIVFRKTAYVIVRWKKDTNSLFANITHLFRIVTLLFKAGNIPGYWMSCDPSAVYLSHAQYIYFIYIIPQVKWQFYSVLQLGINYILPLDREVLWRLKNW